MLIDFLPSLTIIVNMKNGFTLLELSIVLVIIGLIIGGITVGADMIRSAELNAIVSDVRRYQTAINTFKLKYNALPGDMKNAASYWPTECVDVSGNNCNGNGNGHVNNLNYAEGNGYEHIRAWQHLSLSEVISGNYTGLFDTNCDHGSSCWHANENAPESSIPTGIYNIRYVESTASWGGKVKTRNVISYGSTVAGMRAANGGRWHNEILSPADTLAIENKMDDGGPFTGRLTVMSASYAANCVTGSGNSGSFVLSFTSPSCVLLFDYN